MLTGGNLELHTAIVIRLNGGGDIEVGERDFLGAVIQDVNCLAHDGVVGYFLLMAIPKY
jgi:hypothetical protein